MKHRLKERQRHIPVLCLADILGPGKSRALFKIHTENKITHVENKTGYNFTSKVRSKLSFIKAEPDKRLYE